MTSSSIEQAPAVAGDEQQAESCETTGHDLEQVRTLGTDELTGIFCPRCGRSWAVHPGEPDPDPVGYVVVATTSTRPETQWWMTPKRRETPEDAQADLDFWTEGRHLAGAGLRLAKLVLMPE